jgi:hypothetical protein
VFSSYAPTVLPRVSEAILCSSRKGIIFKAQFFAQIAATKIIDNVSFKIEPLNVRGEKKKSRNVKLNAVRIQVFKMIDPITPPTYMNFSRDGFVLVPLIVFHATLELNLIPLTY